MLNYIFTTFDGTFYKWNHYRPMDLADNIINFLREHPDDSYLKSVGEYSPHAIRTINEYANRYACKTAMFVKCDNNIEFDCIVDYVRDASGMCIDTFIPVTSNSKIIRYIQGVRETERSKGKDVIFICNPGSLYEAAKEAAINTVSVNEDKCCVAS